MTSNIYAFMGKGGVGKTTLSVELAKRLGKNTVVVGLDRQHNALDLIVDQKLDIPYFGLYTEDKISKMMQYVIDNTFLKNFQTYVPLIAPDFVSIIALADLIHDTVDGFDNIVIDFPPNHSGLSMINMPNILENMAYKALTLKHRVKKAVTGHDKALEDMDFMWQRVLSFKEILKLVKFIPVGIPQLLPLYETVKLIEQLIEYGYHVGKLVVNMMPEFDSHCTVCTKRLFHAEKIWKTFLEFGKNLGIQSIQIHEGDFSNISDIIQN